MSHASSIYTISNQRPRSSPEKNETTSVSPEHAVDKSLRPLYHQNFHRNLIRESCRSLDPRFQQNQSSIIPQTTRIETKEGESIAKGKKRNVSHQNRDKPGAKPPSKPRRHDTESEADEAAVKKPPQPRNKSQPFVVGVENENAGTSYRSYKL
ncbi:Uncharacterized protein Rs2_15153 [Raphanus sativus]|nr:Uncharacterized protein Rs2_15153 [Raphanus sativus]